MAVTKESKDIFVTGAGKEFDSEYDALAEDAREAELPVIDAYLLEYCADNKATYIQSIKRHLLAFAAFRAVAAPQPREYNDG